MADEAQTETLGWATMDVAKKWNGWGVYTQAAQAMKEAIEESSSAKGPIRDHIKRELVKKGAIKPDEIIDFAVSGDKIRIVKVLGEKKGRTKGVNLF
jgi:hypothetical protein